MPISTDLSVSPYFDDYNEAKNYHQVLFKPSVAVQTRELNVLQSILQNQIELFGDNIFTQGTIVSGCNFQYFQKYPYVKLVDTQLDGQPAALSTYVNLFAKNSANLQALVLSSNSGYVSQAPDLNTLFVRYINSGNSGTLTSFSPNDVLTIFDSNNSIWSVNVPVGGTGAGLANTDNVVFLSAMSVTNSAGGWGVNDVIRDPVSNAHAVVTEVNTTAVSNSLVLKLRPFANDLTNTSLTSTAWTFNTGNSVNFVNATSNATITVGTISSIIGTGATATPLTSGIGAITSILMTTQGNGYYVAPYATIKTSNTSANAAATSLTAVNYLCQINVASNTASGTSTPTGYGYAFGVSEGVIFQKGYFLYVPTQSIVVSKYSSSPDALMVGFQTIESIINSNTDTSLLDNSSGTTNSLAPGADRLQLAPTLVVVNTATATGNTSFFPITGFSGGYPYLQNQQTQYSQIGRAIAKRTYDTSGDFVIQPFSIASKTSILPDSSNATAQAQTFTTVVDPGMAYISGSRIKTETNYNINVRQGTDSAIANAVTKALQYGNFINVNEMGGIFNFQSGDYVTLYDTAKQYLSNGINGYMAGNTANAAGSISIGTARLRSLVQAAGAQGVGTTSYKMYVYDVNMNTGYNFANVRSIGYSNSGITGVCDTILQYSSQLGANVAALINSTTSQMLFPTGMNSTKTSNSYTYTYNTIQTGNTSGNITVTLTGSSIFPFTNGGSLSTAQLQSLTLIPTASAQAAATFAGTYLANTANTLLIANTGAPNFLTTFVAGDYLLVGSADVRRVQSVVNTTALTLDRAPNTGSGTATTTLYFPKNTPIDISRSNRFANVSASGQLLSIYANVALAANVSYSLTVPVVTTYINVPATKTTNRNTVAKLNFANNTASNIGPWPLGVPDIFRLKNVYLDTGTNILAATNSVIPTTSIDVTNQFYIDHNQDPDFYDQGYLYQNPQSTLSMSTSQGLIVVFDNFTYSGPGFITKPSYAVDDTKTFSVLNQTTSGGSINTNEIPEMLAGNGQIVDLIDCVDFRPRVANTAAVTANLSLSTVNPSILSATAKFGSVSNNVNFPLDGSAFTATHEYYLGRTDLVIITDKGQILDLQGTPGTTGIVPPVKPSNTMIINYLNIPPYPSIPQQKDTNYNSILDKKIANRTMLTARTAAHSVTVPKTSSNQLTSYQPVGYKMSDIAVLERRIAALEYYVSLSQVEQSLRALSIPSSLNGSINRYKYGFFADTFTTANYSALSDPQYNAQIINNEVVPRAATVNLGYQFNTANATTAAAVNGSFLMLPYTSVSLINQNVVTAVSNSMPVTYPAPPVYYKGTLTATPATFTLLAQSNNTPETIINTTGVGSGMFSGFTLTSFGLFNF